MQKRGAGQKGDKDDERAKAGKGILVDQEA
jgi:hypothetical protein